MKGSACNTKMHGALDQQWNIQMWLLSFTSQTKSLKMASCRCHIVRAAFILSPGIHTDWQYGVRFQRMSSERLRFVISSVQLPDTHMQVHWVLSNWRRASAALNLSSCGPWWHLGPVIHITEFTAILKHAQDRQCSDQNRSWKDMSVITARAGHAQDSEMVLLTDPLLPYKVTAQVFLRLVWVSAKILVRVSAKILDCSTLALQHVASSQLRRERGKTKRRP